MAQILILQEATGEFAELRKSLEPCHDLHYACTDNDAFIELSKRKIDLVITRVHLEQTNVFKFISAVKQNQEYSSIPIICFCGSSSQTARQMNASLAQVALTLGAAKYLSIDNYFRSNIFDCDKFRSEIEALLH